MGHVSMAAARAYHDGLLAHVMFGGLPPMRGHIYRELLRPDFVMQQYKPGCKLCSREHACSIQHCLGDRLVYKGGTGVLECILPHHKSAHAWGGPIHFMVPPELVPTMRLHVEVVLPKLSAEACGVGKHMFLGNKGLPFTQAHQLQQYFKQDIMCARLGFRVGLNPHALRHLFVGERRSSHAVAGPADRGVAMVMGHTLRAWDRFYDLDFMPREAQQAVNDMKAWREALRQQHMQQQEEAHRAAGLGCAANMVP
jgi:hypothetical protein